MSVILSLETSTTICSVALQKDGGILAQAEVREPQSHASQLAPLVDEVRKSANIALGEISAVAVACGPGSYTGLRIGVSMAKGLCFSLNIPLIAIGTLELLAYQGSLLSTSDALLCPMIDARRMEVYCLVADKQLNMVEGVSAKVIDPDSFKELLDAHAMLFFGSGAEKCSGVIRHPRASFLDGIHPSAAILGLMAEKKFAERTFEDLAKFTPLYLKEFVAKRKSETGAQAK